MKRRSFLSSVLGCAFLCIGVRRIKASERSDQGLICIPADDHYTLYIRPKHNKVLELFQRRFDSRNQKHYNTVNARFWEFCNMLPQGHRIVGYSWPTDNMTELALLIQNESESFAFDHLKETIYDKMSTNGIEAVYIGFGKVDPNPALFCFTNNE